MRILALDVGSSSVRAIAYGEDGAAEPGDAQLEYSTTDADELVDACRAVLAQVGEGDGIAISCFWHSLLPLDERRRIAFGVAPREERRRGPLVLVEGDQRVPEARDRERVALPDLRQHRAARVDQLVGIVRVVLEVRVAGLGRPRPRRRRPRAPRTSRRRAPRSA